MRKTYRLLLAMLCTAFLVGCSGHNTHSHEHEGHVHDENDHTDDDHEHETLTSSEHDDEDHDHAGGVSFPKALAENIDFAVVAATMQPVGTFIRTVAEVLPAQDDETVLSAKADGIVILSSRNLSEGMSVHPGLALCQIDASQTASGNLTAEQQKAQAELQRAKSELARLEALRSKQLALESEVQQARANYENASATMAALQKGFGGGIQTVAATRNGYLKQLLVRNGEYVTTGQTIAIITQNKSIRLKAEVPARLYSQLREVTDATLMVDGQWRTLSEMGGRLLSYGREATGGSPLLPISFEVNNVSTLVPGTLVDMCLKTRSGEQRLCVPSEAVIEEMGNYFIFVEDHPEFYVKRQVRIGASDGIHTAILDGLKAGEKVVSRGALSVKLQQASGAVDPHAGHSH